MAVSLGGQLAVSVAAVEEEEVVVVVEVGLVRVVVEAAVLGLGEEQRSVVAEVGRGVFAGLAAVPPPPTTTTETAMATTSTASTAAVLTRANNATRATERGDASSRLST